MNSLFIKILNMSLNAGWLILLVLVLRLILKRAPKWIHCLLWGLVGLRLALPFSVQSILSLLPKAAPIPSDIEMMREPAIDSGIDILNDAINPMLGASFAPEPMASANPLQILIPIWSILWLIGIGGMLLYGLISCLRLRKICKVNILYKENVYFCDAIDAPFIFGIIKPKIYLPSAMEASHIESVLAHEKAHLKRGDHWWKPIGFLLLSVYWFNPLLWLSYALLCRDIERACDEKVIKEMDEESKKNYSQALLSCSLHRAKIAGCPLAFGEVGVKERVRSVLHYKKPALWLVIAAILITLGAGVCFLTDPLQKQSEKEPLTLEKVLEFSQKGEGLSLADFEAFEYVESGSGLYIREYPIDEKFSFSIGFMGGDQDPIYFYLHARDSEAAMIDIRYEDVEQFIATHKNNRAVKWITSGWHCAPVGYLEEEYSKMLGVCGVPLDAGVNSRKALPVKVITAPDELNAFIKDADFLNFNHSYQNALSFRSVKGEYDAAFFKESNLYLVYCTAPTLDHRFSVKNLTLSEGILTIQLEELVPKAGDTAMEGWLICISAPKEQVQNAESVRAYLSSSRPIEPSDARIGYYRYRASEEPIKPSLMLYSNGRFTFTLSSYSSYLGIGRFHWEDDRLTLSTDDGKYTYFFDYKENALYFDADASSDQRWLSDIPDGAKFN